MSEWTLAIVVVALSIVAIVALLKRGSLTVDLRKMSAAVESLDSSLGIPHDTTIHDVLVEVKRGIDVIVEFEAYQRTRNHDLLNHLSIVTLGIPQLIRELSILSTEVAEILTRLPLAQDPE